MSEHGADTLGFDGRVQMEVGQRGSGLEIGGEVGLLALIQNELAR